MRRLLRPIGTVVAAAVAAAVIVAVPPSAVAATALRADEWVAPRFGPVPEALGAFDSVESGQPHQSATAVVNGRMVFTGGRGAQGRELWVTDGTPEGTRLIADIQPGSASSDPTHFVAFRGRVWFSAFRPDLGREWWVTDGTPQGTRLFADLASGNAATNPGDPVVVGNRLFFGGTTAQAGNELMVTDGTVAGTRVAVDTIPGAESGFPDELTPYGGRLVYRAQVAPGVSKPFVSDGSPAGTARLDGESIGVTVGPKGFTVAGERVFFSGLSATLGLELWSSRGMAGDARPVRDIYPGADGSDPRDLTALGGRLMFVAQEPVAGRELWTSDGTAAGTRMVRDIAPPVGELGRPQLLQAAGGLVHFRADDGVHGEEPWVTDGSAAGTRMLADLQPGAAGSKPSPMRAIDGRQVFAAGSGAGYEPWVTDGTRAGTRMLADLAPGAGSSNPWAIGVLGKTVVFATEPRDADPVTLYAATIPVSATTVRRKKSYSHRAAQRRRIVLRVRVSATAPLAGTVTLTRRGRVVGTADLRNGRARVRITKRLRAGKHRIVVSYGGSVDAQPSRTRVVVKVRPRPAG